METLRRDPLFVAVTRPVTLAGAPYGFVIGNAIAVLELFLIFRSPYVLLLGVIAHGLCWLGSLREPRLIDLWLVRIRRCPPVRNRKVWQCNSYRP